MASITSVGRDQLGGQAIGIEPDSHGVLAAEGAHVADARNPSQYVECVDLRVVVEERRVIASVGRNQVHHADHVGRRLLDRHAELLHFGRKHGLGGLHAVLDVDGGDVLGVADVKGRHDRGNAVAGAVGVEVDHPLDAVELLLDRRGDRLGDGLSVGAGEGGGHLHLRRRDLGILGDRQQEDANAADQEHEQGQHGREDRPADEEIDHEGSYLGCLPAGDEVGGCCGFGSAAGALGRGPSGSAAEGAGLSPAAFSTEFFGAGELWPGSRDTRLLNRESPGKGSDLLRHELFERRGDRLYGLSLPHELNAFDDHFLTGFEPGFEHPQAPVRIDAADLRDIDFVLRHRRRRRACLPGLRAQPARERPRHRRTRRRSWWP